MRSPVILVSVSLSLQHGNRIFQRSSRHSCMSALSCINTDPSKWVDSFSSGCVRNVKSLHICRVHNLKPFKPEDLPTKLKMKRKERKSRGEEQCSAVNRCYMLVGICKSLNNFITTKALNNFS